MRSITYPCGCVNEVQPNTALRSVAKCEPHKAAQNVQLGADYYRQFGIIDAFNNLCPTSHVAELTEAVGELPLATGRMPQVLEVGAGCSPYFSTLTRLGYNYTACDKSEFACQVMRRHGARALQCRIEDADLRLYDVIIAAHVLEHVFDPVAVLNKLSHHLQPDGVMYIIVPNSEDPVNPDHLWTFNPTALRILLTNAGLSIVNFSICKRIDRESWIYVKAVHDPDSVL